MQILLIITLNLTSVSFQKYTCIYGCFILHSFMFHSLPAQVIMEEALAEIDGMTRRLKLEDKQFVILCSKGSSVVSTTLFVDVCDGEKVWSSKLTADGFAAQQKKLKISSQAGVLSIIK